MEKLEIQNASVLFWGGPLELRGLEAECLLQHKQVLETGAEWYDEGISKGTSLFWSGDGIGRKISPINSHNLLFDLYLFQCL